MKSLALDAVAQAAFSLPLGTLEEKDGSGEAEGGAGWV